MEAGMHGLSSNHIDATDAVTTAFSISTCCNGIDIYTRKTESFVEVLQGKVLVSEE